MGFDDSFKDATGERYEVRGAFDGQGNAAGFLTTSWHTRQYGRCSSGSVSWHARLATNELGTPSSTGIPHDRHSHRAR